MRGGKEIGREYGCERNSGNESSFKISVSHSFIVSSGEGSWPAEKHLSADKAFNLYRYCSVLSAPISLLSLDLVGLPRRGSECAWLPLTPMLVAINIHQLFSRYS